MLLIGAGGCTMPNPAYVRPRATQPAPADAGSEALPSPPDQAGVSETRQPPDVAKPEPVDAGTPEAAGTDTDPIDQAPAPPETDVAQAVPPDLAPDSPPPTPDLGPPMMDMAPVDPRPADMVAFFALDTRPASGNRITSGANSATLTMMKWNDEAAPGLPTAAQSLEFDGTGHVRMTIAGMPRSQDRKTIALWFKATSSGGLRNLIALFNQAQGRSQGVQIGFNGARIAAWRFGADSSEMDGAVPIGSWHHVTYTYNPDLPLHRLFLDGVEVDTFGERPANGELTETLLGTYEVGKEMYRGLMNDVRIYNRILSDGDIASLARRP